MLAAVFAGLAVLFTLGEMPALVVFLLLAGTAIAAFFVSRPILKGLLAGVIVVLAVSVSFVGFGLFQLANALTSTDGPVDAPDPVALASAEDKVNDVRDSVAFQLELTEAEMTAYVLEGLQGVDDNPLQSVALDVVDGSEDGPGRLNFDVEFKSGGVGASGSVTVVLEQGAVQVDLADLSVGSFDLPGVAQASLEDLVERVADFNETLENTQADIQSVVLGDDRLVITGTRSSTDLLTSQTLLSGLREAAASAVNAVSPPPERLGPGTVGSTTSSGTPVYVALGDSLAANVGVADPRDGYVSRFHNQLEQRDTTSYGLQNFGKSGETTGTMIRGGQLDQAVAFMETNLVSYVTIDIGANNLLGHLGSAACSDTLTNADCQSRLQSSFEAYEPDIALILEAIQDAAPDATVIFLTAYNPFSLGLGTAFEAATDSTLADFNAVAAGVARDLGVLVADGQAPMQHTTAATTHMLDANPDIHPVPIGFDILGGALLDALS